MGMEYSFYLILERSQLRRVIERLASDPLDVSQRLQAHSLEGREELNYRRPTTTSTLKFNFKSDLNLAEQLELMLKYVEGGMKTAYEQVSLYIGSVECEDYYCNIAFSRRFNMDRWFYGMRVQLPVTGFGLHRNLKNIDFYLPLVEKIVEIVQPYYSFSASDIDEADWLQKYDQSGLFPWNFYWNTMIFGSELVAEKGGSAVFDNLPAYYKTRLEGGIYWLSELDKLGNENPFSRGDIENPAAHWKAQLRLDEAVIDSSLQPHSYYYGDTGLLARLRDQVAKQLDLHWSYSYADRSYPQK
jgi:hypothetical protein